MSRNNYAFAACVLQTFIMIFLWMGTGNFDVSRLGQVIIAVIESVACVLVLGCAFAAGRDE